MDRPHGGELHRQPGEQGARSFAGPVAFVQDGTAAAQAGSGTWRSRTAAPTGYTTLTPFLVCSPAAEAIGFYGDVFGATVVQRMDGPDGTVVHAELDLGLGRLQLGDPNDAYGLVAPSGQTADGASSSTCIYVADVDAVFARAVERGATVR